MSIRAARKTDTPRSRAAHPGLRRAAARSETRARIRARAISEISPGVRDKDPLAEQRQGPFLRTGSGAIYLALALALHIGAVVGVRAFGGDQSPRRPSDARRAERVTVKVVTPPLTPPLPPSPEKPLVAEPEPEAPEATSVVPEERPPEPPPRRRPPSKRAKKVRPTSEPVADPVDVREARPADQTPRRRVVGLSFESTVSGGGPAFAVGNTRMGRTGERAADPREVRPISSAGERPTGGQPGPNRVATRIPKAGASFTKPTRISRPTLDYPDLLKARNIEGDVVVLIEIALNGQVKSVRIVKGSGYPEFDRAAERAARKERFVPAKRNGEPIDYTLKYTYRFRIKEA